MDTRTFAVLRLLADGKFHSGEKMAETLGVTRGSIWNDLHVLDGSGLEIVKVRGLGYQLAQPLTLLDKKSIEQHLAARASKFTLEVHDSLTSTNTLLLEKAGVLENAHGSVIAAEWQTQGRGRRGRAWVAAPGMALTFSLLWRFAQGAGALAGLSLAVGVAIARALAKFGINAGAPLEVGLKWPNDVVWHGRKLAGVLIESQGDVLGPTATVIGIGINVRLPDAAREQIDQAVVDLAEAGVLNADRNRLLATLLLELDKVLTQFAEEGFAPLKDEWQRRHVYHRKAVKLVLPDGGKVAGEVEGVDKDGALLLATTRGRRRFHGGEVSLRL